MFVNSYETISIECLQDFAGMPLVTRFLDDLQNYRLVISAGERTSAKRNHGTFCFEWVIANHTPVARLLLDSFK